MNIRVLLTFPMEDVGHLSDPLVGHDLAAEEDGAAAVQHRHVAPAVLVKVMPQHGTSQLRPKHGIMHQYKEKARGTGLT